MSEPIQVLYVDGDADLAERTARSLERADDRFTVETATGVDGALASIRDRPPDCVVSDHGTTGLDGIGLLETVREDHPDLPFIVVTEAYGDVATDALSAGASDCVQMGSGDPGFELLADRIDRSVDRYRTERKLERRTERLEDEIERRDRAQERYRSLFERFPEPTFAYVYEDGEPRVARINEAVTEVFGYASEEAVGEPIDDLIVPTDRREEARRIDDRVRAGEAIDADLRRQTADGPRDFRFRNVSLPDDDEIDGYAIYADVTERKERERELELYRTMVDTVPDAVYAQDEGLHYIAVNEGMAELTGYSKEELVGSHLSLVVDEDPVETAKENRRRLIESDAEVLTHEYSHRTADGEEIPVENRFRLLPSDDGEFRGTAGVIRDISERLERERELERRNERLEQFARFVSHDLRNPLKVVGGSLELAAETGDSEHFERCRRAVDRMDRLIEDLLTLAREGEAVEVMEPVSLAELGEDCWETVATADAALAIETGRVIRADRSRFRQLLENLFGNAIEHGDDSVTVRVGDADGGFYVSDDGPGIPPGEREAVFEMGYSTADEGTGFGLSIAEQVAEAHDWQIHATESGAGGARFEITGVEVVE